MGDIFASISAIQKMNGKEKFIYLLSLVPFIGLFACLLCRDIEDVFYTYARCALITLLLLLAYLVFGMPITVLALYMYFT